MNPDLRKQLRDEANSVKDCFTTFSFQALGLSGVILGAIANYQPDQPLVGAAAILIIVVVLTVSRIGVYKYATANRHFAFELFADTLATPEENLISWEEALQAWRVVQATLFDQIYFTRDDYGRVNPLRYLRYNNVQRKNLKRCRVHEGWWFDAHQQVTPSGAKWYPGRYLETMQGVLHFTAVLAVLPLVGMAIQLGSPAYSNLQISMGFVEFGAFWLAWALSSVATVVVWVRTRQMVARRELLEFGLLSIATSAVVWLVVIRAHRIAQHRAAGRPERYLPELGIVAREVKNHAGCIWHWLESSGQSSCGPRRHR